MREEETIRGVGGETMVKADDDNRNELGELEITVSSTDFENSGRPDSSNSSSRNSSVEKSPVPSNGQSQSTQRKSVFDTLKRKSVRTLATIPLLAASYEISRKSLRSKMARFRSSEDVLALGDIPLIKPSWRDFDYAELAAATNNFSPDNMIGKGGCAEVYRGCLSNGQIVAIKKLTKKQSEDENGISDFLSELGIIIHLNHPRAARLIGFGVDGGLYLVLQFSPHGSLASMLFGSGECLQWGKRFKVAVGVAEGLQYLHHECPRRIIHRDIKASNILLTEDFEAEISDFGLAKWLPENRAHHVMFPIEGTFGYLAPEYFMHGIVDEKTDIFAYGVLLLELITGRHAVTSSKQSLAVWAKPLLDSNLMDELVDPRLRGAFVPIEMNRAILTASMCIHHLPSRRPKMTQVVNLLTGVDGHIAELKQQKSLSPKAPKALLLEACELDGYTCSNYLNDLNRHRQLVME